MIDADEYDEIVDTIAGHVMLGEDPGIVEQVVVSLDGNGRTLYSGGPYVDVRMYPATIYANNKQPYPYEVDATSYRGVAVELLKRDVLDRTESLADFDDPVYEAMSKLLKFHDARDLLTDEEIREIEGVLYNLDV